MATTKITLEGDSKGAQKALNDAKAAAEGLDSALESVSTEAATLATRTAPAVSSLDRVARTTQRTGEQMGKAVGAIGSLSSAVGAVNPQLGAAVGLLGSLGGAFGSITTLLNPMTLGIAAAAAGFGLLVHTITDSRKRAEEAREAYRKLGIQLKELDDDTRRLERSSGAVNESFLDIVSRSDAARRAVEAYRDSMVSDRAAIALEQETEAYEAALERRNEAQRKQEAVAAEVARELERWEARKRSGLVTSRIEEVNHKKELERLALAYAEATNATAEATIELEKHQAIVDENNVALQALGGNVDNLRNQMSGAAQAARASTPDYAAMADRMILAAVNARDLSDAMSRLGTRGVGRELARSLGELSDEALKALGATEAQIATLRQTFIETQSGAERLKGFVDGVTASIEAQAAATQALAQAEAEAQRVAYARQQLGVDQDSARVMALKEQAQWLAEINRTSAEQEAIDAALVASAEEKLRLGQLLSAEERKAYEARTEMIKASAEEMAQRIAQAKESLKLDSSALGYQGAIDMLGGIADAMGTAIASGENMGKAIAKSAKQMVSGMAKQFGQLFLSIGSGMLFLPGQQAAGAGLIAAGFALQALGGAIGGGKKGASGSANTQSRETGTGTTIVEYTRRETPGMRARQEGERYDNMMRYGIDRGRAFA